jgi:hypothetical protein
VVEDHRCSSEFIIQKKRSGSGIERLALKLLPESVWDDFDYRTDIRLSKRKAMRIGKIKRPETYRQKQVNL